MLDPTTRWLLHQDQPSVRLFALIELIGMPSGHPEVVRARKNVPERGWVPKILSKQRANVRADSGSLYRPKYTATNWLALILSDLGMTRDHPEVEAIAELFLTRWMGEGENIFKDEVCIVGNTARMLTKFGYKDDPRVRRLFDRLLEDQKSDGGWHCFESSIGTLDCWEALAAFASIPISARGSEIKESIKRGAEFYLERALLQEGKRYPPWFRLHYPVHYYYDVLVGLDLLTTLGYGADPRLDLALGVLRKRRREDGRWNSDRVHPDPKNFAWGPHNMKQKVTPYSLEAAGRPSKWITLTALRVLKRVDDARGHGAPNENRGSRRPRSPVRPT